MTLPEPLRAKHSEVHRLAANNDPDVLMEGAIQRVNATLVQLRTIAAKLMKLQIDIAKQDGVTKNSRLMAQLRKQQMNLMRIHAWTHKLELINDMLCSLNLKYKTPPPDMISNHMDAVLVLLEEILPNDEEEGDE